MNRSVTYIAAGLLGLGALGFGSHRESQETSGAIITLLDDGTSSFRVGLDSLYAEAKRDPTKRQVFLDAAAEQLPRYDSGIRYDPDMEYEWGCFQDATQRVFGILPATTKEEFRVTNRPPTTAMASTLSFGDIEMGKQRCPIVVYPSFFTESPYLKTATEAIAALRHEEVHAQDAAEGIRLGGIHITADTIYDFSHLPQGTAALRNGMNPAARTVLKELRGYHQQYRDVGKSGELAPGIGPYFYLSTQKNYQLFLAAAPLIISDEKNAPSIREAIRLELEQIGDERPKTAPGDPFTVRIIRGERIIDIACERRILEQYGVK